MTADVARISSRVKGILFDVRLAVARTITRMIARVIPGGMVPAVIEALRERVGRDDNDRDDTEL